MHCQAVILLLLAGCLATPFVQGGQNRFLLAKKVEVRCSVEKMTVIAYLDAGDTVLVEGRLRLTQKSDQCQPKFQRLESSLLLELNLNHCALAVDTADYRKYSTMVDYSVQGEFIETFPVTCVHPNSMNRTISALIESNIYKNNDRSARLLSNGEPFNIFLGAPLRFETVASLPWYNEQDFYTYPVTCWTSDFFDQRSNAKKVLFLENGCPAVNENGRGMSRIVHDLTKAGSAAVELSLTADLVPNLLTEKDGILPQIFLHCDVIVCSGSTNTGFLHIPKCPKSSFCAGESAVSHRLPAHLVDYEMEHVVNGPIGPIRPPPVIDQTSVDDCIAQCRKTQLGQSHALRAESSPRIETVLLQGIPTTSVALVSFFSFLCGVALTISLWVIHIKTDPRRVLNLFDREASCSSEQPESTLISNCQ